MHGLSSHNRSAGRRRFARFLAWGVILVLAGPRAPLYAQEISDREYKVKAAFVYNFLKFVVGGRFGPGDGQAGAAVDPNAVILVGVIGKIPAQESFAELRGKSVQNKRVQVRFFQGFEEVRDVEQKIPDVHPQMQQIRRCHVLFLCPSEKPFLGRILPALQKDGILVVGDTPGFLEAGGTINLVIEDKKVRFEINTAAAARAKLQIRSSLLRLALRTLEHDSLERRDDEGR